MTRDSMAPPRRLVRSCVAAVALLLATTLALLPGAAEQAAAQRCLDKLEIETPGQTATAFARVTLPAGATFRANVRSWTSAPAARTWLNGFNAEIRLSPMRADGFPGLASTSQRDAIAADGPWGSDGYGEDEVFSYTNPSNAGTRDFVLEVGYWNQPSSGITGRTEAHDFTIAPAGGSPGGVCVTAHTPPARPSGNACDAWPTFTVNGPALHTAPFEMARNATLRMLMHDERPLRFDANGNVSPLLRSDYLFRVRLYGRSGPGDSWHYIARDSHRSQNNWLRRSYLGSTDISLRNRSNYTEVKVVFTKWISRGYAASTPLDVTIQNRGGPTVPFCSINEQLPEAQVVPLIVVPSDRVGEFNAFSSNPASSATVRDTYDATINDVQSAYQTLVGSTFHKVSPPRVIFDAHENAWVWCRRADVDPAALGCVADNAEHNLIDIVRTAGYDVDDGRTYLILYLGGGGWAGARDNYAIVGDAAIVGARDGNCNNVQDAYPGDGTRQRCINGDWHLGAAGTVAHELGHTFGLPGHDPVADCVRTSFMDAPWCYRVTPHLDADEIAIVEPIFTG